jgi:pimeloyl-ACP methyl ester carboxylesterase
MPYLAVQDIDIWLDRAGIGPALLAISGSRGDLRRKPNLLSSSLPRAFDALAFDQRGLGRTSKPDKPYSMGDYADDAAALMDAVGWTRANIVGVSFGGMVALELVLRHPDRVAKLALCSTSPGGEGGCSFPLHTLQNLPADERAQVMVSISDTRCDAGWGADNPVRLQETHRKLDGGSVHRRTWPSGRNSTAARGASGTRHLGSSQPDRLPSSNLRRPVRWDRLAGIAAADGEQDLACSKVAINFSGRTNLRSPRSSSFSPNEALPHSSEMATVL